LSGQAKESESSGGKNDLSSMITQILGPKRVNRTVIQSIGFKGKTPECGGRSRERWLTAANTSDPGKEVRPGKQKPVCNHSKMRNGEGARTLIGGNIKK